MKFVLIGISGNKLFMAISTEYNYITLLLHSKVISQLAKNLNIFKDAFIYIT